MMIKMDLELRVIRSKCHRMCENVFYINVYLVKLKFSYFTSVDITLPVMNSRCVPHNLSLP